MSDYSRNSDSSNGSRIERMRDHASSWTTNDLQEKNISYNETASTVPEFFDRIKDRSSSRRGALFKCQRELPDCVKFILNCSREALNFSFQFDDNEPGYNYHAAYEDSCKAINDYNAYIQTHRLRNEKEEFSLSENDLLAAWRVRTTLFLKNLKLFFLTKHLNDSEGECKGQFQQILMDFTEIFFLKPEIGSARKRELVMKGITVSCDPDVHFMKLIETPSSFKTLMVLSVEVKGHRLKDSNDTDKGCYRAYDKIDGKLLGQHACELLSEIAHSAFQPNVLGMICHRSDIIFTFMDINIGHYELLKAAGKTMSARHKCTIYYTEPYDYLVKDDRDKIMELLFWLGCVQSVEVEQSR